MLNKKCRSRLWLYFTGLVFATICGVFLLISLLWLVLSRMGYVLIAPQDRHAPIFLFALGSLLLGAVIAFYVGKLIMRPIQELENAFDALSRGDFHVRLPENAQIQEIREMAQRFNAMAYDLSHIETLRSDFVANVSHEFRTPIATIEGYATLLQNPGLTREKREHYVEVILENSRRLSSMSGNILMISRLENQELVPDRAEYRLDEQLRQCVLMLESKWTQKQIEFDMELDKRIYYGSQALLEQVWLNLLDNAIKHSPAGGTIRIAMADGGEQVQVSIADQGEGMSQEVQKHIFEKFYQADSSHKTEGSGLGLALVKRILELCRGTVRVSSAPGQGSEFTVTLPQ